MSRSGQSSVCCSKIRALLPKILLLCVMDRVSSSLGNINRRILHLCFNNIIIPSNTIYLFVSNSYIKSSNMFPLLKRLLKTRLKDKNVNFQVCVKYRISCK
jgi:hypothetical protein